MADRTDYRWVFWTQNPSLEVCPICGEKTIDRTDEFRTSGADGSNSYACRLIFKCGHVFGARAIDRKLFKEQPDFFSRLDKKPPGDP